jgi:hypothetical protein
MIRSKMIPLQGRQAARNSVTAVLKGTTREEPSGGVSNETGVNYLTFHSRLKSAIKKSCNTSLGSDSYT